MNTVTKSLFHSNFHILERGWLSSNTIVITGESGAAVVDTGYVTHAAQTVSLIESVLARSGAGLSVDTIVNTHLHSDHCGGNASVKRRWPGAQTLIPPGHAREVLDWDVEALTYEPTGQTCERFGFDATLVPGSTISLAGELVEVHAAPGHDPHSVVLFHPKSRGLISADALWQNGFGVVFPALEGIDAFGEVAATLDVIESLEAAYVIPGHGGAFMDVGDALVRARGRLGYFRAHPHKHAVHGIKVLIKFKMLDIQRLDLADLHTWVLATPYFARTHALYGGGATLADWAQSAIEALVAGGSLGVDGDIVYNSDA